MSTRARHILALLGTLIVPAFAAWQTGADLPAKIALAVGVVIAALLNVAELGEFKNVLAVVGVIAAPIAAAIIGHLTPGSGAAYVATLIPAILLNLQKALGAAPGAVPSKPLAEVTDLPTSKLPRGPAALAILLLAGSLLLAAPARAQTQPTSPQLGGCLASGAVCFGTAADVVLTKVGLSGDNKGISGGFSTGVGYGATVAPDKFYATGLDLFLNVTLSGASGVASRVSPAIMLHAMNYLFLGVGLDIIAPTDTVSSYGTGWSLLLGFGSTITSITPGYAKREAARQLAAERASAGAK